MADEVDRTDERMAAELDATMKDVRYKLGKMDPGVPGDCDKCGEEMPRLVEGICCRCRDKLKLP